MRNLCIEPNRIPGRDDGLLNLSRAVAEVDKDLSAGGKNAFLNQMIRSDKPMADQFIIADQAKPWDDFFVV